MPREAPVDGFELAYDRTGDGPPAVLLHGWPGSRRDYRDVAGLIEELGLDRPVLEGIGHFVPLHVPDAVAAAIRAATGTSA